MYCVESADKRKKNQTAKVFKQKREPLRSSASLRHYGLFNYKTDQMLVACFLFALLKQWMRNSG